MAPPPQALVELVAASIIPSLKPSDGSVLFRLAKFAPPSFNPRKYASAEHILSLFSEKDGDTTSILDKMDKTAELSNIKVSDSFLRSSIQEFLDERKFDEAFTILKHTVHKVNCDGIIAGFIRQTGRLNGEHWLLRFFWVLKYGTESGKKMNFGMFAYFLT